MSTMDEPSACADTAALYRRKFDWPCTALGHSVWTLAGEALDAVDVPEHLGSSVVANLRGNGRPHAVIDVPGEQAYWRFLVQPRATTPHGLVRELARRGAIYLSHATIIELPPTRVPGGELRWLRVPEDTLPSLAHVVAAVAREHKSRER